MALAGRVALVTGATSGIGAACARLFAANGACVAATGRNRAALDNLINEIKTSGGNAVGIAGDVTNDDDVIRIVDETVKTFGSLHVLVNSAGVLKAGATDAVGMDNWDFNVNVNARGAFCFMKNAIPHMKASVQDLPQDTAAIVNVSSVNGMQSFGGCISYCASKAAVDMMTRCASVDLAPSKIRVNSVNPGVVVTELQKRGGLGEEAYEAFLKRSIEVTHPLGSAVGRVATPEDIAEAVMFLASDKASFVTGTTLAVDGGRRNAGAR